LIYPTVNVKGQAVLEYAVLIIFRSAASAGCCCMACVNSLDYTARR
jgi:hypothetical protein